MINRLNLLGKQMSRAFKVHPSDLQNNKKVGSENKDGPVRLPDAAHTSGFRSQFASLQLSGHNLTLGFQFSGQSLELQFLCVQQTFGINLISLHH